MFNVKDLRTEFLFRLLFFAQEILKYRQNLLLYSFFFLQ